MTHDKTEQDELELSEEELQSVAGGLRHELGHTIQQQGGTKPKAMQVGETDFDFVRRGV